MDAFTRYSSQWNPPSTPPIVKWLLLLTVGVAVVSALTNGLFHFFNFSGPQEFLSLSWPGLRHYYFWQLITYPFILDAPTGITFGFFVALFFNSYFLWIIGSGLQEAIGDKHFIYLSVFSVVLAGLAAVSMMVITGSFFSLTGPGVLLLALFVAWGLFYSDSTIFLFFLIPLQAKWVLTGVLGAICLIYLSSLDWVSLTLYTTATLVSYLYSVIVLGLRTPFANFQKFETWAMSWSKKKDNKKAGAKVVNIRGEAVLDDDEFIDKMLTKIAKHGESSLSMTERARMDQISKRRAR